MRDAAAISQNLLAKLCASRRGCFRPEERGLQLALTTLNLLIRNSERQQVGTEHKLAYRVLNGHLITSNVEAEDSGVLVEMVEGLEFVCATNTHLVGHIVNGTISRD